MQMLKLLLPLGIFGVCRAAMELQKVEEDLRLKVLNVDMTAEEVFGGPSTFCWLDLYGRGVGTIPPNCKPDQDRIGLFCYPKCREGYKRWGFDCHQKCPTAPGWVNQGLFCRHMPSTVVVQANRLCYCPTLAAHPI